MIEAFRRAQRLQEDWHVQHPPQVAPTPPLPGPVVGPGGQRGVEDPPSQDPGMEIDVTESAVRTLAPTPQSPPGPLAGLGGQRDVRTGANREWKDAAIVESVWEYEGQNGGFKSDLEKEARKLSRRAEVDGEVLQVVKNFGFHLKEKKACFWILLAKHLLAAPPNPDRAPWLKALEVVKKHVRYGDRKVRALAGSWASEHVSFLANKGLIGNKDYKEFALEHLLLQGEEINDASNKCKVGDYMEEAQLYLIASGRFDSIRWMLNTLMPDIGNWTCRAPEDADWTHPAKWTL